MKKEVAFAILAGVFFGLVFAFGVWRLALKFRGGNNIVYRQTTPKPVLNSPLTISNLNDFDVVTQSGIKIIGKSKPESFITASTLLEDYFTKTNPDGEFEIEIKAPSNLFEVKLTTIDGNNLVAEKKINLVSSEKIEDANLSAFVGTITDITNETIQIKTKNGEILQGAITSDTNYQNLLNKPQTVKLTDIAIGDFAVLIGVVNGNKVLKTGQVLITKDIEEVKTEVVAGKLLSKTKSQIVVETAESQEKITLPKSWKGPEIKEMNTGDLIILVGTKTTDKFDLRSIYVIR